MSKRQIIRIDEAKCTGCGQCVNACHEGAIQLVNGKAKLMSEVYCDGLGACIGECPEDAIAVVEREAAAFDEAAVRKHLARLEHTPPATAGHGRACPGSRPRTLPHLAAAVGPARETTSQLGNWPVQLHLVSPQAPYLRQADLLLAADCAAYACADFHQRFLRGRPLVIACPKLDEAEPYVEKLAEILTNNDLKSITIVHMEVPCCLGLVRLVEAAMAQAGVRVPLKAVTVSLDGRVLAENELVPATVT